MCRFLSYSAFKRNSKNNPPALIYRSPYQSTNVFGLSTMKSRCRIHSVVRFYFLAKRWKIHLKNIQERKVHQKYCAAREKNQYIISFLGLRASFVYTSCENQIEQKITSCCCCCVFFRSTVFSIFPFSIFHTEVYQKLFWQLFYKIQLTHSHTFVFLKIIWLWIVVFVSFKQLYVFRNFSSIYFNAWNGWKVY